MPDYRRQRDLLLKAPLRWESKPRSGASVLSTSRAITPELLADLVRLGDARLSPDGRLVAFVRTPLSRREKHGTSEIWLVDTEGGEERRFAWGQRQDASPRWSPDGAWLAFTSDRREPDKGQIYVASTSGGEGMPITARTTGVSKPSWSPDSRFLAFLSEDEPSDRERKDEEERRDQRVEGRLPKRTRVYLVEREGGESLQISPDGPFNIWDYCWSPRGDRLAAISTTSPLIAEQRGLNDLMIITPPARHGDATATEVLLTFPSTMSSPRWSPDGETIAFLATTGRVKTVDQIHLAKVEDGSAEALDPRYEGSVLDIRWLPDGTLLFSAQEGLNGVVKRLDLGRRRPESVLAPDDRDQGTFGSELTVTGDGSFAVVRSDSTHPGQVFLGRPGQPLRRLTSANAQVEGLAFRPAQSIAWESGGLTIQGLVTTPAGSSPPYPTVVIIHGGPASAFSNRFAANWHDWTQLLAANGYAVFMPNPRGSTGRGASFADAVVGDIGGLELQDDLTGLDMLVAEGIADGERLAIAGWSHGGFMAAWAVTQTDRFKAAIMGAGVANMISDQGTNDIPGFNLDYFFDDFGSLYRDPAVLWERSPLKHVSAVKTPVLILHGQEDERVRPSQGREFHAALTALGVAAEFVVYPREGHGFREREHQIDLQRRIVEWLKRLL